jgi:hypothetical protein
MGDIDGTCCPSTCSYIGTGTEMSRLDVPADGKKRGRGETMTRVLELTLEEGTVGAMAAQLYDCGDCSLLGTRSRGPNPLMWATRCEWDVCHLYPMVEALAGAEAKHSTWLCS